LTFGEHSIAVVINDGPKVAGKIARCTFAAIAVAKLEDSLNVAFGTFNNFGAGEIIYVKLIAIVSSVDWYVLRHDPKTRLCYCFVTDTYCGEFGDVWLDELESLNPLNGVWVERQTNIELPAPLSRFVQR
jgi:hypothetical protein